ncbi:MULTISPECIES: GbsR/MarR family transcriptional regulator [Niallia]|jgi:DNA-binding transcriptional regulator GbsR (MarR family)|uniref:HTH-type transcriptional regulator n=1 Tax=Niallia circulans TaxID=1397 RepID=A0A268FGZ2_NIACI|nr:GbsR/MarR family transcriptional regulator [Niallia circulans]AYV65816.1 GbsR/MarR family transcriptional regulator [Niallia circulans]AYV71370.1 GbsR/MarR family transcriptional regulator [Niallia circulans]NRG29189.1 GbsR/MarR family transcriptional regulator [Niallia circulans]PAD84609.1 GbsR/MarR family transcriptional regulator [Niallia circulans]QJX61715.1 GbsR/MarR family transcriptional regulator [Niallia circulans]
MTDREQLNIARERVIDSVAQNMDLYGVTESIGRLYGMLLFQKNPMTLDEMKEELGMSKTSMSTSVRTLLELKMVDKVWRKGVRKDLYRAEEDWYQTFIDYFTIKWRLAITENIYAIEKSMNEIKVLMNKEGISEDVIKDATNDLEKMKYALDYYDWLERFVDSLESHEIFNFIPKNKE